MRTRAFRRLAALLAAVVISASFAAPVSAERGYVGNYYRNCGSDYLWFQSRSTGYTKHYVQTGPTSWAWIGFDITASHTSVRSYTNRHAATFRFYFAEDGWFEAWGCYTPVTVPHPILATYR